MYTFYEYPKCSTCRKAKLELTNLGLEFEALDLTKATPSKETILAWIEQSGLPIKSYFNTSGIKYRELGLKDQVADFSAEEAASVLATDGMLIKRPILLKGNQVLQIAYRKPYEELGL